MIRLGLDCHVPRSVRLELQRLGYEIVVLAEHSETDESWFDRGYRAGMTHVYSGDVDLYFLCQEHQVKFIRARPGRTLDNQMKIIREGLAEGPSRW
jgi:hypothetical protein